MTEEKTIGDGLKDIERPIHVFSVLDKVETFHSGHETKEAAEARSFLCNKEAVTLGIRTRYIVK